MGNNKVGTYNFVAEPFHVDFTGKLTMGVLGNHLLNCAGFHATESVYRHGWRMFTACLPTVISLSLIKMAIR